MAMASNLLSLEKEIRARSCRTERQTSKQSREKSAVMGIPMVEAKIHAASDLLHPPLRPQHLHQDFHDLLQHTVECVNIISSFPQYHKIFKIECTHLTRRIKLLAPFFEEAKDFKGYLSVQTLHCFRSLHSILHSARELLRCCSSGSKLYLALEWGSFQSKFLSVTEELEQALDLAPFDLLDLSDEVREQVELVHAQLKRAKGRADAQNLALYSDLDVVMSQGNNEPASNTALERLSERLQLKTFLDLKLESEALSAFDPGNYGETKEKLEQMSKLLARLKNLAWKDNAMLDVVDADKTLQFEKNSPAIPDDFRCPISLELMKDPVIVGTGQTYERACIQQWLDAGNQTCPKTQQTLPHLILTPNYVLKSLISQWCETHGIELPRKIAPGVQRVIDMLLQKLSSGDLNVQREATGELRVLAKRNTENRICIAAAGAIPLLVGLLSSSDQGTQEHAVTALLNLSIHEGNKGPIIAAGAILPIVKVLQYGSMEARENAAATLFSLSVVDENKVTIGASGAIPALVGLLEDGTLRGRKDAATALFNLAIYQANKPRAVKAAIVPPLMKLLVEPASQMVDEALAILSILTTHPEGRAAISQASATPILINLIRTGSPRNKENAVAALFALCSNDPLQMALVRQTGARSPLKELSKTGTARAQRKAVSLLEHMSKQGKYFLDSANKTAPDIF